MSEKIKYEKKQIDPIDEYVIIVVSDTKRTQLYELPIASNSVSEVHFNVKKYLNTLAFASPVTVKLFEIPTALVIIKNSLNHKGNETVIINTIGYVAEELFNLIENEFIVKE